MYAFLLQDWITIRGQSNAVSPIVQSADGWLDLEGYQDVVMWLETKEVTLGGGSAVNMTYETSPKPEDGEFVAMSTASTSAGTVAVSSFLKDSASQPLARFLRWKLSNTGATTAWDVTFRVWVAANRPGT